MVFLPPFWKRRHEERQRISRETNYSTHDVECFGDGALGFVSWQLFVLPLGG